MNVASVVAGRPLAAVRPVPATRGATWRLALAMFAAAFAIRAAQFGNPMIHVDENFYLLVGDRMLHGALPYVDIWDRKPVGLFLLYAAIRLLGGEGIVQYQVVATLFAGATAFVVARIAGRVATPFAAGAAGVLYLLMLGLAGGTGGQAPVFYNLFVAGAALIVLDLWTDDAAPPARLRDRGLAAMALVGIAMQIKYNALFEGIFLGIALIVRGVRAGIDARRLVVWSLGWMAAAAAPTALALAWYAAIGEADAFLYANFFSIASRATDGSGESLKRLGKTWVALHIPVFTALLSMLLVAPELDPDRRKAFQFILAWMGAALASYLVFGTYFDHYALSLMPPLAICCAPVFSYRRWRLGPVIAIIVLSVGIVAYMSTVQSNRKRGGARFADAIVRAIEGRTKNGVFVYDGDTITYLMTGTMPPTRMVFPPHLNLRREANAIGVDPIMELQKIMASRPGIVVDTTDPGETYENPPANRFVRTQLRKDYRPIATVARYRRTTIVYERIPGR